jgi:L-Lysine epsilon oxidase N-terminal/L-lysine epsilon oxidase C-terminal domain
MDPASIEALRVYPPLGIARVGNAVGDDDYIIGPEVIGGSPTLPNESPARYVADFRTSDGRIKRQAARFRVYAHLKDGTVEEITAKTGKVKWRVAIANLKAGWYDFQEAMDLPDGLSRNAERRNRDILIPAGRSSLDIVPGLREIEGPDSPAVKFSTGNFWGKPVYLGELRSDSEGRLLFLGGRGQSKSFQAADRPITHANNVGWHDDVSDGPVRATVTFSDGSSREAEPGYVVVAPPNFAPGLTGLVTMDDAVRETFQKQKWIEPPSSSFFTEDIWPIFDRLTGLQWVNHGLFVIHGHGSPLDARDPAVIDRMRNNTPSAAAWRQDVFKLFREPNVPGTLVEPALPQIYGDGMDTLRKYAPHATAHLTVTRTQFAHLQRWAAGNFEDNWPGSPPQPPSFSSLTPAQQVTHLERAPLHDCMGGPFHPGIEMTWVMRLASIWKEKEPYRLKVLATDKQARQDYGSVLTPAVCVGAGGPFDGVAAGGLTRFLGLPWQTDGVSCNSSEYLFPETFLSMPTFWGARNPDQVLAAANYEHAVALGSSKSTVQMHKHFMLRVDWLRDLRGFDFYRRIRFSVDEWHHLGMVLPIPDPPAHLPADVRVEQGRTSKADPDLKRKLVKAVEQLAAPSSSPSPFNPSASVRIRPKQDDCQGEI